MGETRVDQGRRVYIVRRRSLKTRRSRYSGQESSHPENRSHPTHHIMSDIFGLMGIIGYDLILYTKCVSISPG